MNRQITAQNTAAHHSVAVLLESLAPKVPPLSPPTGRVGVTPPKRLNGSMDQAMLYQKLKGVGLDLDSACQAMYFETGAVVKPRNVRKQFQRKGQLSEIYAAAFTFLIKEQAKKRKHHHGVG